MVEVTDEYGIAIVVEPSVAVTDVAQPASDFEIDLRTFPPVDEVCQAIFDSYQVPRLGGISSGKGWSSFSTAQRCLYGWDRKYQKKLRPVALVESPALAVGTLIHTFLAIYYTRMIDPTYPLTPDTMRTLVIQQANPQFVDDAWRVFHAYALHHSKEEIAPLAIEMDLKDPRTGESCRFDLIAYYKESIGGRPAGTYVIEHKSAGRFDRPAIEGWHNDGEVLGQVMLWQRLGLDLRFGKLQGVIVNLLGKQKEPQFHRTWVHPSSFMIEQHKADLRAWDGLIQLSRGTGVFPRSRNNCINRYGFCDYWDHCMGAE